MQMASTSRCMFRTCGLILLAAATLQAAEPLLRNGSFEASGLPRGWDLMQMGPSPIISHDRTVKKDAEYSVRVTAHESTMAALSQVVAVEPGRRYVLRGWIKTQDIKPDAGADMIGTLIVLPIGAEEAASLSKGQEHRGTTDWTQVSVEFTGPAKGQVYVFCSLIGQGSGTGTMWVDGLELEAGELAATQPASAPASQPADAAAPALHRVRNGSFEEAGAPEAWDVMVVGRAPTIVQDSAIFKEGQESVRLTATSPTLAAVAQTIAVEPGRVYHLQGWVRTENLKPNAPATSTAPATAEADAPAPTSGGNMLGTLVVLAADEESSTRLATGPNHEGTHDWKLIELDFVGPKQGRVHIFASLCGQGGATGTVWFDDLRIKPGDTTSAATQPTTQPTTQAATSPAPPAKPAD